MQWLCHICPCNAVVASSGQQLLQLRLFATTTSQSRNIRHSWHCDANMIRPCHSYYVFAATRRCGIMPLAPGKCAIKLRTIAPCSIALCTIKLPTLDLRAVGIHAARRTIINDPNLYEVASPCSQVGLPLASVSVFEVKLSSGVVCCAIFR